MFTLLIIEDEDIIREGLTKTIDWEQYGFKVIGTAINGEEGLKLYKDLKPDVIMTDIKMPVMDGLELLKAVKMLDNEVQVVLLSGHEEFAFAKRGVEFGAYAYILKLDLFADIGEVFKRLHFKLEEAFENKKKVKELVNIKISQDFLKIIKGEVIHDMPIRGKYYNIAVVWHSMKEDSKRVVEELKRFPFFIASQNERYIILLCTSNSDPKNSEALLLEQFKVFKAKLDETLVGDYYIGVGSYKTETEIVMSYKEAMKIADYGRYTCHQGIYFYANEKSRLKKGDIQFDMRLLTKFIYLNSKDKLKQYLEEGFRKMLETEKYYYSDLRVVFYDILMCLNKFVKGMKTTQETSDNIDYLIGKLNMIDSMLDMKDWIFNEIDKICGRVEEYRKEEYFENIQKVISFIDVNYCVKIKMQEMADLIYMSPPYFSSRFKEIMGSNFTDYLRKKRIEKSIELLMSTDKRIVDIAEEVGYEDEKYFFRIFKNEMQMSPYQYRETMR